MSASGAGQQPFLNEETVVIVAPTQVWSARSGDYWSSPIHGLYHADWRLIRSGELRVDGRPIELAGVASGPGSLTVRGLARSLDDDTPDPRVLIEWHRTVAALAQITGEKNRLAGNPALARSIRHRFPYIDPLHHLQVELLRRWRAAPGDERVQTGIHICINGIAAGLRNTG